MKKIKCTFPTRNVIETHLNAKTILTRRIFHWKSQKWNLFSFGTQKCDIIDEKLLPQPVGKGFLPRPPSKRVGLSHTEKNNLFHRLRLPITLRVLSVFLEHIAPAFPSPGGTERDRVVSKGRWQVTRGRGWVVSAPGLEHGSLASVGRAVAG